MNLLDLNDDELKIFLEHGVPLNIHRDIYTRNSKIAQKLKGFRPNTAPLTKLSQTSYALIKKEKNSSLIVYFTNFYEEYKNTIKNDEQKMINEGYPESIAYSLSITKGYTSKFLPIFFKLEGINIEDQKKIINDSKIIDLIDTISAKKIDNFIKNKLDNIEKNVDKSNQRMFDDNRIITTQMNEITKLTQKNHNDIDNINKRIDDYDNIYIKSELFISRNLKIEKQLSEITKKLQSSNEPINNLLEQIDSLKKELIESKTQVSNGLIIESIINNDYEIMDDYLSQNIGDIIENLATGSVFDVFREYLIEVLYSNKPLVCSSRNSKMFLNIISSIISGGNYHIISLDCICSNEKLIKVFESLPSINGNKVILIKNMINVTDYTLIIDYIKTRPINEKYIFEIMFDKEILFMPIETLNQFNFYIGNLKEGKIDYKYYFNFNKDKRQPILISEFIDAMEAINVHINNRELFNTKIYGILAYSIIPFVSIHENVDMSEIVNKLTNQSIRAKCETVIHG